MRKHLFTTPAGINRRRSKSPYHRNPKDTAMFAKLILVATLVLAGTSLTFVADASAAPGQAGWRQGGRNGELSPILVRSLPYYRVGPSPLCPPDHSYRECFYPG
jgi:hypothetical protein